MRLSLPPFRAGMLLSVGSLLTSGGNAGAAPDSRPSVTLTNAAVQLVLDLNGGAVGDFRRMGSGINPLNWATPATGDNGVRGFGHFLCLDRWGPPSEAEGAKGMPYHGEAANVVWTREPDSAPAGEGGTVTLSARLPRAGLRIRRQVRLSPAEPVFLVREEVTNENVLGRLYNMVQHPTIAPPFLDEATVVDCNGRRGFAQGGSLPTPEEPSAYWPRALGRDGESVDLRRLAGDPEPNVVSYAIEDAWGWVTATSPKTRLLLGYVWRTSDYPWVSLWRDVRDGRPAARGLEFGTTGLHQPYPILVKKGRIWDRPLYDYLDAGESKAREYVGFLLEVPADFRGVGEIRVDGARLVVRERATERVRELTVGLGNLGWR